MTSVELYKLEKQNTSSIHLFLAGMFWYAWEFSAYQFTKYFSPYKIHWKFVKKVGTEMVYLGFPKNGLTKVKEIISEKNLGTIYIISHFLKYLYVCKQDFTYYKNT